MAPRAMFSYTYYKHIIRGYILDFTWHQIIKIADEILSYFPTLFHSPLFH